MTPEIRLAEATDILSVVRLVQVAYALYIERIGRSPAPMTADYAEARRVGRLWVIDGEGGELDGMLATRDGGDRLLLDSVAVRPGIQGLGIGKALLARADEDARELGRPIVALYTNAAMTENLTFYPHHGYREVGRGRQDGFDRVFYERLVPPLRP